ncbi:MAG: hypothetical protein RL664_1193 [Bacteroidota bacterium]
MNDWKNILGKNYVNAVSYKRLKTYIDATEHDIFNGIKLYQKNITLSSNCLRYIALFEVTLRNEVDRFYKEKFKNQNWISLFPKEMIRSSGDKGIEKMNLGFWVQLFAPKQFREGGQCLRQIYLYRPKGVSPRVLFNDLLFVLNFRIRIAHHESICFNKQKEFSTDSIRKFEEIILRHLVWLGYDIPTLIYFKRLDLESK